MKNLLTPWFVAAAITLAALAFFLTPAPAKAACLVSAGCTGQTSFLQGVIIQGSDALRLTRVGTSTPVLGSGLSYTGTIGQFLSGVSGTLSVAGLTVSNFTSAAVSQWTNDAGYLTTAVLSIKQSFGTAQTGAITLATSTAVSSNGITVGQTITNSTGTFTFTPTLTVANIPNGALQNSTISGVSLGGSLFAHTHDTTLSGTSYNGSAAVSDWGLNLSHANTWTALQQFGAGASTTQLSVYTKAYFGATATTTIDSTGNIAVPSGSGIFNTGRADGCASWVSGQITSLGTACGTSSGGITTLGPTGQGQTGSTQTLASTTGSFNGLTLGITIVGNTNTQTFTPGITGTLGNAGLTNSTISGIALGASLNTLTAGNTSLTFSGNYDGSTARTVVLNVGNANTWSATQTFTNSPVFSSLGAGTVNSTSGGTLYNTSTSTPTLASEFTYGGTLGQFISGVSGQLSLTTNGTALSKLVQIGANTILGNNTGATGNVVAFATSTLGIAISDTTGTLAVNRGGTGAITLTGVLKGNGTSPITAASNGTDFTLITGITCTNQVLTAFTAAGVGTCATVSNAMLANSTISGVALGGTLGALSATNATLTFSGSYTGASAQTVGLNLTNPNSWTGLQQFANSSTSIASFYGPTYFGRTATTTIDGTGNITIPSGSGLTNTGRTDGCATWASAVLTSTGVACGSGGGGGSDPFTHPAAGQSATTSLMLFNGNASSTQFSATQAYFGGTATSTFTAAGFLGIGSSTPFGNLSIQALAQTNPYFAIGSSTGSVYTISPATKLYPQYGLGTSTPWGAFSIEDAAYDNLHPLFTINTTENDIGQAFNVSATSTVLTKLSTMSGMLNDLGVRIGVGIYNYFGIGGLLDQFVVQGRINTAGWLSAICDEPIGHVQIISDGAIGCAGFSFAEDTTSTLTALTTGGQLYGELSTTAANDGAGIFANSNASTGWLISATSTPVMEVEARINTVQNATTTSFYIGYFNVNDAGSTFETLPTSGCYFTASSTQADWRAVCRSSSVETNVDTGIASSTVLTGTGGFRLFRIEMDNSGARFYMKANQATNLVKVATIATNVPTTVALNAGAYYARTQGTAAVNFDLFHIRLWWRDWLPDL